MAITIPEKQQAAVVEKPGKDARAVVKEIPVEEPKEGEVLIKMVATGGKAPLRLNMLTISMSYRFAFTKGRLGTWVHYGCSCRWP